MLGRIGCRLIGMSIGGSEGLLSMMSSCCFECRIQLDMYRFRSWLRSVFIGRRHRRNQHVGS